VAEPLPSAAPGSPVPRTVKGLAAVSLFNDFASEMVYPLLPAFVTRTLGGSATSLAALDGAAELAAAATKWVSGDFADRPGWRKPLIVLGYFSAILIRPFTAIASAAWQVIGFRVLDRIGKGMRTPARDAMIADVTPLPLRGRAFGFHRAADHFGSIPGALIAWWLLSHAVDVRRVLSWSAVPGLVAGLILLVVLRGVSAPRRLESAEPSRGRHAAKDATGRVFWAPVLALAALILLRLPETLLLLRLQDLGVGVANIPLVWAGLHLVRSAVSYPGGWLTDQLGPRATVAAGSVCFATGALFLSLSLPVLLAITAFLGLGTVAGLTESSERALVARLAPKRTGRGFGAYHAVTGIAALPAALLFGALYQNLGASVAFTVSGIAIIAMSMLWLGIAPAKVA
jgi:MFS family permease